MVVDNCVVNCNTTSFSTAVWQEGIYILTGIWKNRNYSVAYNIKHK